MSVYGNTTTSVLLAVEAHPGIGLDTLAGLLGMPRSTVHSALVTLRRQHLVEWDPTKRGTTRATVRRVDVGAARPWFVLAALAVIFLAMLAGAALGRLVEPDLPPPTDCAPSDLAC